jgi:hypothetical protein
MRTCEHGCSIPAGSRAVRAPECLACHQLYLEAQAAKAYLWRQALSAEEREAYQAYQREYSKTHRASKNTARRLWRAERRLIEACNMKPADPLLIQKRRYELAVLGELLQVFAAW